MGTFENKLFDNFHLYLEVVGNILNVSSSDLFRYLRAGMAFHETRGPFGLDAEDFYKWVEGNNIADKFLEIFVKLSSRA